MAAIDPSAVPEADEDGKITPRATLKLIRQPFGDDDEDSEDEDDDEYMRELLNASDSEDDEEEEEEANGGPSDPAKSKKARKAAALKELLESIDKDGDDEDMEDAPATNGVKKSDKKGKAKASEDEDEEEEDSEDEDDEGLEIEEFVICTLDSEKNYQQPIDITIGEDERVFFKVSGGYTVHLTGNYVVPDDHGHNHRHEIYDSDEEDEDDEDYDESPDEDELYDMDDEEESDDLDGLEDPRITEVDSEEEAPKLVAAKADKKGKNKRAAEETLDELISKSAKPEAEADVKLSKKQQKKLKNNAGDAVPAKAEEAKKDAKADAKGDKKSVQFAEKLEQGPTGSTAEKKADGKGALGVKTVNGVKIDDKKLGSGPAAKKGDRVGMRYIGKLTDGKVFDSNKKGKPFTFKLGVGEVIKGWDIGVAGMSVGGERRLTIPAHLAYGSKSMPGIPGNSTLVFDIKCLEIK
jgi:FK506-binding nuclear protein